jgi:putative transposase
MTRKDAYAIYYTDIAKRNAERAAFGLPMAQPLSKRQFYRRFKERLNADATAALFGKRYADGKFKAVNEGRTARRAGELYVIDHTQVDVMTIDAVTGLSSGSPWLAVAMDLRTRAIVGWHLTFAAPGLESLTALMRQFGSGWNISADALQFDGVRPFMPSGLPRRLIVDNALENVGRSFPRSCEMNGIDLEFAPVRYPQGKGVAERFFETLNQALFHGMPGGKPMTPQERKRREIDPEKTARLTLEELKIELGRFIALEYHHRPHSALGCSPQRKWSEESVAAPPLLPACLGDYEATLGIEGERSLSIKGIHIYGLQFNGPEVSALLNDLLPRASGRAGQRSVRVFVRILPDDLSRVFVLNPVSSRFVEVQRVSDDLPRHLSMFELKELRKEARAKGAADCNQAALAAVAADRATRLHAMRRDKKLSARRRAQRHLEYARPLAIEPHGEAEPPLKALPSESTAMTGRGPAVKPRAQRMRRQEKSMKVQSHQANQGPPKSPFDDLDEVFGRARGELGGA